MSTQESSNQRSAPWIRRLGSVAVASFALAVAACEDIPATPELASSDVRLADFRGQAHGNSNVVEVVATGLHMKF